MDREGELYKSDVDDPGEICPEAIEAADLIDDAIELARISGNWEGTYTSIMATVDNAIRKANSISPEQVEPPGALLRDVIDYAEGGKVLEPWMVRGLISLRAQLAERTRANDCEGCWLNDDVNHSACDFCCRSKTDLHKTSSEIDVINRAALSGKEKP